MNTIEKVRQMAHLKQKQISDNSCKAIIIDTLLEATSPLTKEELSKGVLSLFHVLISKERLDVVLTSLANDHIILIDSNENISIETSNKATFIAKRQKEIDLRTNASKKWICILKASYEISGDLEERLNQSLPVFLRTLFVKHGVKSYELLTKIDDNYTVDIKQIAGEVAGQYDIEFQNDIRTLLPTVFQSIHDPDIIEYLIHGIKKAVGYVSEVISPESLNSITSSLRSLVLYLDTNILYRLLHLQGDTRYESIKETLDFCRQNGVKLKISAATKKEFSDRISYDAKVLREHPVKTDLIRAGYKYRTSDNYVSTYWAQTQSSGISVDDYIQYYKNFDLLLDEEQVEVEEIEVDEEVLLEKAKDILGKLSQRDSKYDKNASSLWHDAYSLAYVQKMQKVDAQSAIDTGCLFLTTDQAITSLQREDPDFKNQSIVAIAPSQLLQMFGFTKPDSGYEETFIKFFAASSLGSSFDYTNDDIQEILSRISHYQGVSARVAERILARELLNDRYFDAKSEEDKEEIIYNAVSEELLNELEMTKEEVKQLKADGEKGAQELSRVQSLFEENKRHFDEEIKKLNALVDDSDRERDDESAARKLAEAEAAYEKKKSDIQVEHYVDNELKKWKSKRYWAFYIGLIASIGAIVAAIYCGIRIDSGHWGILGLLAASIPLAGFGAKGFSEKAQREQAQSIREKYVKMISEKL